MNLPSNYLNVTVCALLPLAFVAVQTAAATPAQADTGVDTFLNALGTSGATSTATAGSSSLGGTICTAIAQPGQTVGSIASGLAGQRGTSLQMSKLFTGLAISMYCPTMMPSLAGDEWLSILGNTGN